MVEFPHSFPVPRVREYGVTTTLPWLILGAICLGLGTVAVAILLSVVLDVPRADLLGRIFGGWAGAMGSCLSFWLGALCFRAIKLPPTELEIEPSGLILHFANGKFVPISWERLGSGGELAEYASEAVAHRLFLPGEWGFLSFIRGGWPTVRSVPLTPQANAAIRASLRRHGYTFARKLDLPRGVPDSYVIYRIERAGPPQSPVGLG